MLKTIYTNTSKPGAIMGLLALTVGTTYCTTHAEEIVNGVIKTVNDTSRKVMQTVNHIKNGEKPFAVWSYDENGNIYDTGARIYKK
jgi:antitoxin component YwqK of YwqJK toxin-antitoxin module